MNRNRIPLLRLVRGGSTASLGLSDVLLVVALSAVAASCQNASTAADTGGNGSDAASVSAGPVSAIAYAAERGGSADGSGTTDAAPDGGDDAESTDPAVVGQGDSDLRPPRVLIEEKARIAPLTGEPRKRALRDFQQVLDGIVPPDYLQAAEQVEDEAADADAEDKPESPTAAVRAYVRGRVAYRRGDRWEAIDQLERARELDPNSAEVLRLLGQVYFARGDSVRGAQRLKEAVRLAPDDAESLFLLGRFASEKGRWEEAIATLGRAGEIAGPDADPALQYLRPFYLGQALLEEGYDAAAVEQFRQYLKMPEQFTRTTGLLQEVAFLSRQRGRVRVWMGDALCRLGRLGAALEQYAEAAGDERVDRNLLTARRVYVLLREDRPEDAEEVLMAALGRGEPSPRMLRLVSYLAQRHSAGERFAERVRSVYREQDRPAPLALAVAELMDDGSVAEFLTEHLEQQPDDLNVYRELVRRLAGERPGELVRSVLQMIRARPETARQYTGELMKQEIDADRLLEQLEALPEEQKSSAEAWYLRGALRETAGRMTAAAEAYDKALAADEGFISPHLANVELQLKLGRHQKALELLKRIPNGDSAAVRFARCRALAGLDRLEEASAELEKLLSEQPRNVDYRLLKARIQRLDGEYREAERTLWSILDLEPKREEAYVRLFRLYENQRRIFSNTQGWVRLMRRVQREIPESRIARLKMATWYAAEREFDRAEKLLMKLLEERPDDDEALAQLTHPENGVLGRADKLGRAEEILLERLDEKPDDTQALNLLRGVAQKRGTMEETFYPRWEKFLQQRESSFESQQQLVELYINWNQPKKAAEALEQALDEYPERAAAAWLSNFDQLRQIAGLYMAAGQPDKAIRQIDEALEQELGRPAALHYLKALIYQNEERTEEAEEALQASLEADPEYARANNDLGYLWAERNRNLERALEMTRKAVAAQPESGAYLDSLGWVYYKLGRFDEAVKRLEEARTKPDGRDPVILDHLGDALWRAGQRDRAQKLWRNARQMADTSQFGQRSGIDELRAKLDEKLEAAKNDEAPPVAPLPEGTEAQDDSGDGDGEGGPAGKEAPSGEEKAAVGEDYGDD